MAKGIVLEICVESVDCAVAAERGGADRIELCRDLFHGGTTPSPQLIHEARRTVTLPIHVLIRPRKGDFCYSDEEFRTMKHEIDIAKQLGMDGIVIGLLDRNRGIDVGRTSMLVELARSLPVTFHHAFDECSDLESGLESVITTGAARILSAGGPGTAIQGLVPLEQLIKKAGSRIVIMPGGSVDASNVRTVLSCTGAREVHTSVGMSRVAPPENLDSGNGDRATSAESLQVEERVREIRELLNHMPIS